MGKVQKVKFEKPEASAKKPSRLSLWYTHRKKVFDEYKSLSSSEQMIRAKLTYQPEGKLRSVQNLYKTVWSLRNPQHGLKGAELKSKMNDDFVDYMLK